MKILWMTSLRPLGKSKENDNIQNIFLNSILTIDKYIKFSFTQFDDPGVSNFIKKMKIMSFFINYPRKLLPNGKKYSNKIMLENALKQYLKFDFTHLVYSTADIIIPADIFEILNSDTKIKNNKEFCALVYPNILIKNGAIKSTTTPHYGIDIFVYKLKKTSVKKILKSIKHWDQYDWGINDNFYVSLCDLLNIPIYNIYKNTTILKYENDFKTINETRKWQITSWKENKKYFLNFLNQNNISTLYAHGSYYFLLLKIFRFSDLNLNLGMTYIKFYLSMPIRIIKKILGNFF